MALESGTYISDLTSTNPTATDPKSQGDDHIRLIKTVTKATFPNVTGAVTPTHTELNYVDGVTSAIQTQIDTKGAITGQAWTGTHTFASATSVIVPTPTTSTQAVTKAYADGLSFATVLPAQTGKSRNVITTDGTTASWTYPSAPATYNQYGYVTLSVFSAASKLYDRVTIDSTRELLIFKSTAAIQAVVWDDTAKAFGASALIRTVATNMAIGSLLYTTDRILIMSCQDAAATLEAVVLSISGTTITVGTAATATLPENMTGHNGIVSGMTNRGVACGSSYVFGMRLASSARLIAVTVSGTTPTIGTTLSLVASANTVVISGIDSTRLLAVHSSGGVVCIPITVSAGTTLTAGTSVTITGSAFRYFAQLSTGRFAIIYTNTNSYGAIVTVAGTVATETNALLNAAADTAAGAVIRIGDQLIVQCSTTIVNVLTDVSGTATAGTGITTQTMDVTYGCCGFGSDYAVFSGTNLYVMVKISGNNPSLFDSGYASTGVISTGITSVWRNDAYPTGVLSSSNKSCTAIKSATGTVLSFSTSGPDRVLNTSSYPIALDQNAFVHQSASVLWAAGQMQAVAKILIVRLEMI